jgi:hypothetical protein
MNLIKSLAKFSILVLSILAQFGCGYALQGAGSVLPPDIKKVYIPFLEQQGWKWVSAPKFEGRKARCSDMPKGVVIARQAHHLVAVIDGVPNDTFNPSHKMVYGYWAKT